ncbi:GNAT family N-acetyltransferase [uncultured Cohaesibacter sp.]|uniref:GNAT family N-acetyltransferase n=1 Tax=uncultured Cohaesibacter sp. TaxID=1002546 RepID=UPI002AABDD10|nr:GNAT family N-acetyltransferase [uncultured Cohaesibacter sp.]
MQPHISLRSAVRSDFPAIAALQAKSWALAYRSFLPPHYIRDRLTADIADSWKKCRLGERDLVLLAINIETAALVGFISIWSRPSPFIDHLHCHPSSTGLGIGSQLLRAALTQLAERGEQTASLSVLIGNDGARRFYLRHGANPGARKRETLFGYPVNVEYLAWEALQTVKLAF